MSALRKDVLRAYRKIFAVAKNWEASEISETKAEREHIKDEARRLFRMNKDVRLCTCRRGRVRLALNVYMT